MINDDELINPPLIGVSDDRALCPPMDVPSYMKWLKDNREALREHFGMINGERE
jgi:hypothetical protein